MATAKRQSNMELLRIVAMAMIVVYHLCYHCVRFELTDKDMIDLLNNGLFNHPIVYRRLLLVESVMPFGNAANGVFILISGYFLAQRGRATNIAASAKKLLSQVGFAVAALCITSSIWHAADRSGAIIVANIDLFNSSWWFVGYYLAVVTLGQLWLNRRLMVLERTDYRNALIIVFALLSLKWSGGLLDGLSNGARTFATGFFLYSLGGYIRKFDPFARMRSRELALCMLVIYLFIWQSWYATTVNEISAYVTSGESDAFIQPLGFYSTYNIVSIVLAVCIFELFRRLSIPANKTLNHIAGGTFMIYLIHDTEFVRSIWLKHDFVTLLYNQPMSFCLHVLIWSFATYAICLLFYEGYRAVSGLLENRWEALPTEDAD